MRGRGLKPDAALGDPVRGGRPHAGAWIETPDVIPDAEDTPVAPARGRQLFHLLGKWHALGESNPSFQNENLAS